MDSKGQRVSGSFRGDFTAPERDAVGLRTPVTTVQVFCVLPIVEDSEAGHLLELVRLQAVTRREARKATQNENPLVDKTATDLLATIRALQGSDPLYQRLKKELSTDLARNGYKLDLEGLLLYQGRVIVPA